MRPLKITPTVTDRSDPSLDRYLTDISLIDLITPEKEVELAQRIKKGDEKAVEELAKANLRFVISVAKQYQYQGLSLPELINEGNIGLVKAAKKFDETRGFKFISYAVWPIRAQMLLALSENVRIVKHPLNQIAFISKINKAIQKLEQHLSRHPTEDEISDFLEISIEDIKDLMKLKEQLNPHISLDVPLNEDGDITRLDTLTADESFSDSGSSFDDVLFKKELENLLDGIPSPEKEVIKLHHGLFGMEKYSFKEISEKIFPEKTVYQIQLIYNKGMLRLRRKAKKMEKPF